MNPTPGRIEALRLEVVERFDADLRRVRVVRAPYRICPLGAHIDHQLGPVTAMAIDRSVLLAFAPTDSRRVRLASLDYPGAVAFDLGAEPGRQGNDWGNYARGAALALGGRHRLDRGIVGVTSGELQGGGVSSSAAVGVAYLLALEDANGLTASPEENIILDQEIENGYLGLHNGILDQAAILLSRRGHLTRIDCESGRHRLVPAPPSMPPFRILLAYSGLKKALVGTDYNRRVDECTEAARILLGAAGRGEAGRVLGLVTPEEYRRFGRALEGAPARRAEHFFSEVERVGRGVRAWEEGDLDLFGALMTESGASSIQSYECGSPPLVDLYKLLIGMEGVYGARFSGAGFRGCCVALVHPESAGRAASVVLEAYSRRYPELAAEAHMVLCDPDDAASILP